MKTPESKEKDKICEYLDSIGAWYCKPATYGFGKSGTPDIIACIELNMDFGGNFFAIEVKREGKEPTKLQSLRMTAIHTNGGIAVWGTAEKVIKELDERFRR